MRERYDDSGAAEEWADCMVPLEQTALFRGVDADALKDIAAVTRCRRCQRAELIWGIGDAEEPLYVLGRGSLHVCVVSDAGQELMLSALSAGDVLGLVPRTSGHIMAQAYGKVLRDDTVLYCLPRHDIDRLLAQHPHVASAALMLTCQQLTHAYDRMGALAFDRTRSRLARTLAHLATVSTGRVVSMTHDELATMIGTRRDEVTRILRHFRDLGLVRYAPHQHGVHVVDREQLATL